MFRIIANTMTSMGATGYTTGLAPSMSLGCGAYAGNITSDNITPMHLINIKRLAYERPRDGAKPTAPAALAVTQTTQAGMAAHPVPKAAPVDFVSEDDVRRAIREGRVIRHTRRAILTPAARDLAEGRNILEPVD